MATHAGDNKVETDSSARQPSLSRFCCSNLATGLFACVIEIRRPHADDVWRGFAFGSIVPWPEAIGGRPWRLQLAMDETANEGGGISCGLRGAEHSSLMPSKDLREFFPAQPPADCRRLRTPMCESVASVGRKAGHAASWRGKDHEKSPLIASRSKCCAVEVYDEAEGLHVVLRSILTRGEVRREFDQRKARPRRQAFGTARRTWGGASAHKSPKNRRRQIKLTSTTEHRWEMETKVR